MELVLFLLWKSDGKSLLQLIMKLFPVNYELALSIWEKSVVTHILVMLNLYEFQ